MTTAVHEVQTGRKVHKVGRWYENNLCTKFKNVGDMFGNVWGMPYISANFSSEC